MKQSKVVFFKDSHSYLYGDVKLRAVGTIVKAYTPPFAEDYWLTHSTLKQMFGDEYKEHFSSFKSPMPSSGPLFDKFIKKVDAVEFFQRRTALKGQWNRKAEDSSYFGTKFHDMMEQRAYDQGFMMNPWDNKKYTPIKLEKEYDNESQFLDLSKLEDGVHLELMIFDLETGICGQADVVYIETKRKYRYFDIDDYKTNETKPKKYGWERLEDPLSHLKASKHLDYSIKISMYAYMLEKAGFRARNLAYTWVKNYDPEQMTRIDVDYMKSDVEKIFH